MEQRAPRIKCSKCETLNEGNAAQCAHCGHPLPRIRIDQGAGAEPSHVQRTVPSRPVGRQEAGGVSGPQPTAENPFAFRAGQVIASRYTILGTIGRGGMGCIYRVRDNVLKEEVALKTLLPQFLRDKMIVERFFNEARIARSLSHPNIVRVHDIGMTNGFLYISMEYVKGRSLRQMVDKLPPGERLPVKTALTIVDGLCVALEYAHRYTIHRDIKPENVMVCEDGTVKLMDFGISKLMDSSRLTATSIVMGTPFYMSPEQQKNSAGVDARADVYSVGVVLYEILTGNVPTGVAKPVSQIVRGLPPALDAIVTKAVEPEPKDRYQSIGEFRAALRPILDILESGTDFSFLTKSPVEPPRPSRGPGLRRAAGVCLLLAVVGTAAALLREFESRRRGAPSAFSTDRADGGAPETNAFDVEFGRIAGLIRRLRPQALAEVERNKSVKKVLSDADTLWTLAEDEANLRTPKAVTLARQALQCYLAPVLWPRNTNMVFIPPGEVTIRDAATTGIVVLDGYFIDRGEVTNGRYAQFCRDAPWRAPYDLQTAPADLPVTNVTFYDAEAFAAWAGKGLSGSLHMALPTEAQWARAAYGDRLASERYPWGDQWQDGVCNSAGDADGFAGPAPGQSFVKDVVWSGCLDMAGNVSEWTRSEFRDLPYDPFDGRDDMARLYFGSAVVVRGGNYQDGQQTPLSARCACPFETALDTLGFRCALELPRDLDEIEAFVK